MVIFKERTINQNKDLIGILEEALWTFLTIFQNHTIFCILSIFQNSHYGLLAEVQNKDPIGILTIFQIKGIMVFQNGYILATFQNRHHGHFGNI